MYNINISLYKYTYDPYLQRTLKGLSIQTLLKLISKFNSDTGKTSCLFKAIKQYLKLSN